MSHDARTKAIFDLVTEFTVMSNQLSVRSEVVTLAAIFYQLRELTNRLPTTETLHDKPTPSGTTGPTPAAKPAASTK